MGKRSFFSLISKIVAVAVLFTSFGWGASGASAQSGRTVLSGSLKSDKEVLAFLESSKENYGLSNPQKQLKLVKKQTDALGKKHYVYQRSYQGVPLYGEYIQVHLDKKQRAYSVRQTQDSLLSSPDVNVKPRLTEQQAIKAFKKELESELDKTIDWKAGLGKQKPFQPKAELFIYPYEGETYLAYRIELGYYKPMIGNWVAFVDAHSGKVIVKYSKLQREAGLKPENRVKGSGSGEYASRELEMYQDIEGDLIPEFPGYYYLIDISHEMFEPNTWNGIIATSVYDPIEENWGVRGDDDGVIDDKDAVDAHYYAGEVYKFLYQELGRNSIDGNGTFIESIVHVPDDYGYPMDNAFWSNGAMFYGDGSKGTADEHAGSLKCLSCALDVVAHEMTHGVTEYTANLEYMFQSGALNESISDILGQLIESKVEGDTDWLIGEETGYAIRDMQNPDDYDQPGHMDEYMVMPLEDDHGGVHWNSGIPNHAAYLIATKADAAGLDGKELLLHTTYNALNYLTLTSTFPEARYAFIEGAIDYAEANGIDPDTVTPLVADAWSEVGVMNGTPNETPYVTKPISNQTIRLAKGSVAFNLLETFKDPDNAEFLQFSASSNNPAIAFAMVEQSSLIVTPLSVGTTEIEATVTDRSGASATTTFTVKVVDTPPAPPYYPVTGVSLSKSELLLKAGGATESLTAAVEPSYATIQSVTWSSSKPEVATVSPDGTVTPLAAGETIVTVTTLDGNKMASARVIVEAEATLTEIRASAEKLWLKPNETRSFQVSAIYSDGKEKDITLDPGTKYRSSSPSRAKVKSGEVTAGKREGKATITVRYEDKQLEIPVTVSNENEPKEVKRLHANKRNVKLKQGKTQQVKLTAYYVDGTKEDVTAKAVWGTEDKAVATVKAGVIKGIAAGKTNITLVYGEKQLTIPVTVTE